MIVCAPPACIVGGVAILLHAFGQPRCDPRLLGLRDAKGFACVGIGKQAFQLVGLLALFQLVKAGDGRVIGCKAQKIGPQKDKIRAAHFAKEVLGGRRPVFAGVALRGIVDECAKIIVTNG